MKRLALLSFAALAFAGCSTTADHSGDTHSHAHNHSPDCGHMAVAHNGHVDYLHDGHLHHEHNDHQDEHIIMVSAQNPAGHNPVDHSDHSGHMHADGDADHAVIPHGDHMDYLHNGHLHHPHGDHMDEHGLIEG